MKKKTKVKSKPQYKIKQKYKQKQLLIIFLLLICIISLIVIFARYVTNSLNNFFVTTKEFYFNSDKLQEGGVNYQIDNWSGIDDYVITVNMNSNKNSLISSTYDISYDITYRCSNNVICQLNKTKGVIYATNNTDYFNLTVTPNTSLKTGDKVWIQITANSTSKYQKTLTATFTLVVGKEKLSYEIIDSTGNPYMELVATNTLTYYTVSEAFDSYIVGQKVNIDEYLTLTEENKKKCYSAIMTLTFDPNEVLLDITNNNYLNATDIKKTIINGYEYVNSITIKVDAISSIDFRFYKVDSSQDYTYPSGNKPSIVTVTNI